MDHMIVSTTQRMMCTNNTKFMKLRLKVLKEKFISICK